VGSEEGGVIGAAAAHAGGGGGDRLGFRRKKTARRLTGRARLSVRKRQWGRERGGTRLGRKDEEERWVAEG
jgi:hypothetical protein